jgi:site-specific recombinase XerD
VPGFEALLHRFKRSISVLGRSELTFKSYARNIAAMALHFGKISTELDVEQVQKYLFLLQKHSKTPLQTYFKHTVYGLRAMLKCEGLRYEFHHLPSIKHDKKLPTLLSKEEVWRLLNSCQLLKPKY